MRTGQDADEAPPLEMVEGPLEALAARFSPPGPSGRVETGILSWFGLIERVDGQLHVVVDLRDLERASRCSRSAELADDNASVRTRLSPGSGQKPREKWEADAEAVHGASFMGCLRYVTHF